MRDGWAEYKFKDVATAVKGKLPKTKNEDGIGIPYLTASFLRSSKPDYWIENIEGVVTAEDGDCLILWDGAGAGDLFSAHRGVVSSTMAVVTTQNPKILREFLTLFISSKAEYIKETCRGTTVPHVSPDAIANMDLKIPPLSEQKRIVDLISSIDSYIEALQKHLMNAKRSRNAVLHELLTAGGEGWVEKTLDLVTECSWGNTETTKSKYVDSGYLAYSASGADGFLDWFEHDRTAVVLSAIGAQCGKTWFAEGKWTSIKNTIWLKADNLNLLDKYLFYLSNRDQFWQIRGQAQPFISLGDVKKTKVLLPPIVEQERIIQVISGLDSFQDSLTACLNSSKNLRAGVLSSLLSGEHEISSSYDKAMGAA